MSIPTERRKQSLRKREFLLLAFRIGGEERGDVAGVEFCVELGGVNEMERFLGLALYFAELVALESGKVDSPML